MAATFKKVVIADKAVIDSYVALYDMSITDVKQRWDNRLIMSINEAIQKLGYSYNKFCNIRIYGENVFLFANEVLVTLYQLPNDLRKHVKYCKNGKAAKP